MIVLDDYHAAIDDYGGLEIGCYRGQFHVRKCLDRFLTPEIIGLYDHIFIFSDHGHMLYHERKFRKSDLDYLDNKRVQLLMFYHEKK